MNKFDDFLIDEVYQPIADWIYHYTGKSPLWVSNILLYIHTTALITLYGFSLVQELISEKSFNAGLSILFILWWTVLARQMIIDNERLDKISRNGEQTTANPNRPAFFLSRVVVVIITVTLFVLTGHSIIINTILISALYMMACETPPPARKVETKLAHGMT